MTGLVILDTDMVSEVLKGRDSSVVSTARLYFAEHGQFTFTSVTVFEVTYGLEVKAALQQLNRVRGWFQNNEEIVPTSEDYVLAALTRATARRQGRIVEFPDCLIASVAVRLNRPLVTGNTGDFESIQMSGNGLKIANWR